MRNKRVTKKLHSIWFINAVSEIIIDKSIENDLWKMAQGDIKELTKINYSGSETIKKRDLNISVTRGPIEGHWLNQEFNASELNLFFYATDFPQIAHGWTLYEEDKDT